MKCVLYFQNIGAKIPDMARRKAEWGGRRTGAGRPAELVDPVRRWVLIERSDLEAALRLARKRGFSFSAIVRKALRSYLRRQKGA